MGNPTSDAINTLHPVSTAPPATDCERHGQAPASELLQSHRYFARVSRDLKNRAHNMVSRFPHDREVRFFWADTLHTIGELEAALTAYEALLDEATPNERRRIEQAISQSHPERDYLTPGFQRYLDTERFGRPEHREYLVRDLQRGRQLARVLQQWSLLRGKRTLDVGCSHGGTVMALAEQGADTVGIEIDPRRSSIGQQRVRDLGFQIEWHTGDICDSGFVARLGQFDVIVCQDVLEHVMDPVIAIRHLCSLLRLGGIIYCVMPNKYAAEFILADHHWRLTGLSLLSRPQGLEYFAYATAIPAQHYDVGYLRTEKFYRCLFARGGVALEPVERFDTPDHVLWYAPAMSELLSRVQRKAFPGLRPELQLRIKRRARKVAELYIHASRILKSLENHPAQLAEACHLIVSRLCVGAWQFVGRKS